MNSGLGFKVLTLTNFLLQNKPLLEEPGEHARDGHPQKLGKRKRPQPPGPRPDPQGGEQGPSRLQGERIASARHHVTGRRRPLGEKPEPLRDAGKTGPRQGQGRTQAGNTEVAAEEH